MPTSPAAGNAAPSPPRSSGPSSSGAKRCCESSPDGCIFFTGGPMARVKDEDWVEVASTGQDEEALLIAGLLESAEIPNVVEGPTGGSPWPENIGAFGLSRILVPPERAAEARALLERREKEYLGEKPEPDDGE